MGTGVVLMGGMKTGRRVVGVERDGDNDLIALAWERARLLQVVV
jgi:hypothetical protein